MQMLYGHKVFYYKDNALTHRLIDEIVYNTFSILSLR